MNTSKSKHLNLKERYKFLNDNTRTHEYKIEAGDLETSEILEKLVKIDRQQLEEYFKSEEETYWTTSRRITGKDFPKKILVEEHNTKNGETNPDTDNQAVLFYSNHCHGCKKFGPYFEELSRIKIVEEGAIERGEKEGRSELHSINFNRINNSNNSPEGTRLFGYTPVFAFYKKGIKNRPIVMNPIFITPELLKDFFVVSRDFNVIPDETVEKIFGNIGSFGETVSEIRNGFQRVY